MNSLDLTQSKADKMDKLESSAMKIIQEVFDGKHEIDGKVQIAMKTLGVTAKNRQTLTARESIRFSMAATITEDKKILARYVESTSPQVTKALTGKSKK